MPSLQFSFAKIEENTKQASGFSIIHNIFNFHQYQRDCQSIRNSDILVQVNVNQLEPKIADAGCSKYQKF